MAQCEYRNCDNENARTNQRARFCSERCRRIENVHRLRVKRMQMCIAMKGGCCAECGYDRCSDALTFHHHLGVKHFELSLQNMTTAWSRILAELELVTLLCVRCHVEWHYEDRRRTRPTAPSLEVMAAAVG